MDISVFKSQINGKITAPPSKSHLHRLMIAAALSEGRTVILNAALNDDVKATADAINALGLKRVNFDRDSIVLDNFNGGNEQKNVIATLNMGESGSSLRFILPIVCALGISAEFIGKGRLPERPIVELLNVLSEHGAEFNSDRLPVETSGKLQNGKYTVRGDVSSQYISGLLFALPLLNGDSEIEIAGETVSESYIKLTLETLSLFGIVVGRNENVFTVKGGQKYVSPKTVYAEGDWSSAAFFAVGAAISGEVTIDGLSVNSCQSDRITVKLLREAGAVVDISESAVTIKKNTLSAIEFSADDCPDIVPVAAVALANAVGVSVIRGVDRLKAKESDRLKAVTQMLASFNIVCEYESDKLIIHGKPFSDGVTDGGNLKTGLTKRIVDGKRDHRIVMSAAVFGLSADGETVVTDAECVAKSYKNFFEDYRKLGGAATPKID